VAAVPVLGAVAQAEQVAAVPVSAVVPAEQVAAVPVGVLAVPVSLEEAIG